MANGMRAGKRRLPFHFLVTFQKADHAGATMRSTHSEYTARWIVALTWRVGVHELQDIVTLNHWQPCVREGKVMLE